MEGLDCRLGAVLILAGCDCLLRTCEMLSLTVSDVVLGGNDRGIVNIQLGHTKTGQRHAAFEASVLNDPTCGGLFRAVRSCLPQLTRVDHYIFPHKKKKRVLTSYVIKV